MSVISSDEGRAASVSQVREVGGNCVIKEGQPVQNGQRLCASGEGKEMEGIGQLVEADG